ncbi:sensor histidine kinase [Aestuariimicrobium soli]|uniref:sensor histidine kinase n=1 Tax=Aestuariimicrobium soli TaxID=2035834 RepID=UPI003EB79C8C
MTVPATLDGPSGTPASHEPAARHRGSLSRQLVVRVSIIVAVVLVVSTVVSLLAVRQVLVNQMDDQLQAVAARQARPGGPGGTTGPPRGADELGNPIGTIIVQQRGNLATARVVSEGQLVVPSAAVVTTLLNLPDDNQIRTVTLDDLGSYRVISVNRSDGTYVAAVPLAQVNRMTTTVLIIVSGLTVVAIAVAVLVTRPVVHRSLRPLTRLAETAHQVGQLDLRTGEVALPMRAVDTDPDNEVGQVGRAFNQMLDNVESALAARQESETKVRRFVADASHELRNPLASIRGYAELTRRGRAELPGETGFAMARIESESSRMSSLVEDLLLLARLDSDPNLAPEQVDCVEVVLNAVSDARAAGGGHQWTVALPPADRPVMAWADRHRLVQVVVNLLSNARKHTPAGTLVTASVRAETSGDRSWAVIEVRDTGPGIPEEVAGQVFERFARADVARAHSSEPSTGLGLAIVQAVMAAHGGTASVTSVPGDTRFELRFPSSVGGARPGSADVVEV